MSAPATERDPRVDDYIDALPEWQQAICRRVREIHGEQLARLEAERGERFWVVGNG